MLPTASLFIYIMFCYLVTTIHCLMLTYSTQSREAGPIRVAALESLDLDTLFPLILIQGC